MRIRADGGEKSLFYRTTPKSPLPLPNQMGKIGGGVLFSGVIGYLIAELITWPRAGGASLTHVGQKYKRKKAIQSATLTFLLQP